MNKFKEQFEYIRKQQTILDTRILNGNEYPENKMSIALFVELGELMNELPTYFKHWKKSAVDNKEKALEEYVDCLHFAVSLLNYNEIDINFTYNDCFPDSNQYSRDNIFTELITIASMSGFDHSIKKLFALGHRFGFTWDEIYEMYLKKNKINHERQNGGY